jgi:hypothetical protein
MGEQSHYLYAGKADSESELPVLGFELEWQKQDRETVAAEIAVFLKYPSFDFLAADLLGLLDEMLARPAAKKKLTRLMRRARSLNSAIRDHALFP